jgi:hypothetical protein
MVIYSIAFFLWRTARIVRCDRFVQVTIADPTRMSLLEEFLP